MRKNEQVHNNVEQSKEASKQDKLDTETEPTTLRELQEWLDKQPGVIHRAKIDDIDNVNKENIDQVGGEEEYVKMIKGAVIKINKGLEGYQFGENIPEKILVPGSSSAFLDLIFVDKVDQSKKPTITIFLNEIKLYGFEENKLRFDIGCYPSINEKAIRLKQFENVILGGLKSIIKTEDKEQAATSDEKDQTIDQQQAEIERLKKEIEELKQKSPEKSPADKEAYQEFQQRRDKALKRLVDRGTFKSEVFQEPNQEILAAYQEGIKRALVQMLQKENLNYALQEMDLENAMLKVENFLWERIFQGEGRIRSLK